MWNEINNQNELNDFMKKIKSFYDSCIKEIKYISGAYVNENLSMSPINSKNSLHVVIQCQFTCYPTIELNFDKLHFINLKPVNDMYTCEIFEAHMKYEKGLFYWYSSYPDKHYKDFDGTIICSEKFKWRTLDNCLGKQELYCLNEIREKDKTEDGSKPLKK